MFKLPVDDNKEALGILTFFVSIKVGDPWLEDTRPQNRGRNGADFLGSCTMALAVFVAILFLAQLASGYMICEQLPADACSYAIASKGRRCVLENFPTRDGRMQLECKTSGVTVGFMDEWVETDDCVRTCGLDRKSVGISSDDLLQRGFTARLCSPDCYQNCPNIVDLYFNLALGEGGFLPEICESERNPRRVMKELRSLSEASGPAISEVAKAAAPCSDQELCGIAAYPPTEAPAY